MGRPGKDAPRAPPQVCAQSEHHKLVFSLMPSVMTGQGVQILWEPFLF